VADASRCDATQGGWYYDDPAAPQRVMLCPATCDAVRGGSSLRIVLGCSTIAR
jgi:hypothetical protein